LQEEKQKVRDEIGIMNSLEHPKLLQLAAAYENPREIIMNMEYIGGGELFEKVRKVVFTLETLCLGAFVVSIVGFRGVWLFRGE
jgi:serine/threonine protein kinase